MNGDEVEELNCPVCMCLFTTPVTIQCGHTFCRYCLMNSVKSKNSCPICRNPLTHLSERPKQDETIMSIVNEMKKKQNQKAKLHKEAEEMVGRKLQSVLLLDIRTSDVLFPYTKVVATFELQSPTLLSKLQRFVARQQAPYNQYGVIAKICTLNQLRFNVYECTIEGKGFCKIDEEWVQKNTDYEDQYYYRACNIQEISEYSQLEANNFDKFFALFGTIKDTELLQNVYKVIDPHVVMDKNDPIALYYSILRILNMPEEQKYKYGTQFSQEKRIAFLNEHLNSLEGDFSKHLKVPGNGRFKYGYLVLLGIILAFLFMIYGVGQL